ncbi:MAG TPA: DegQ family serine endoprotease [Thiobacillaceae bacterium]|nr:DegQ family serine endoprotease [Thiobacillaceae bacterium]HNU64248.1 DegQ family serine endoprotease [Thiobacillaceae bacterium]
MHRWFAFMSLSLGLLALPAQAQLPDFTDLAERQSPAVVNITTLQEGRPVLRGKRRLEPEEMFDFFRRMLPPDLDPNRAERTPPRHGQGSGFIISADGYILTNAHVVDEVDEVVVKLHDKREFRAKVVGKDARTDVALIKINADNLPRVTIGNPDALRVGEWVLAVGAPFGFENSVTAGIVSAKGRTLPQENYVPFIQTDVAVNPGNSGGPLFNMRGEVVGMNSQIFSRSGGYMGLSFAIPIDVAMDIAGQLKASGRVERGRLGVMIQEVTADLAESFGLKKAEGALVAEVEAGGPADKAGIQASDIILQYNGQPIRQSIDLPRMVGATKPGSVARLTTWRKGGQREVSVKVGSMPEEDRVAQVPQTQEKNRAGLVVSALGDAQKQALKISAGVLVEEATGAAARAGIEAGDVILAVNNQEVNSAAELARLVDGKRQRVALLVKRGDSAHYVSLRLD